MKKSQWPVIVIFAVFGLLFCGYFLFGRAKINEAVLVGFYEGGYSGLSRVDLQPGSVYNEGYHFLELNADMTYKYLYLPMEGEDYSCSDIWSYRREGLKHKVTLERINMAKLSELPANEVGPLRSLTAGIDRLSAVKIGICIDEGVGFYLIKQVDESGVELKQN